MRSGRTGSGLFALALRILGSAAGLAAADLLAFDLARVTRDETGLAQRSAQRLVVLDERARDAVANGTGLSGDAAAGDDDGNVELVAELRHVERLAHDHAPGLAAEEFIEG